MYEIGFFNEEKVIPKTLEQSKREDEMWYLDNGASNHMTGERSYFSEIKENITRKVKFGDGSYVNINGKGSILFEAKTGEHKLLTDIYYIPELRSNILSLEQAIEQKCDVRIGEHTLLTDIYYIPELRSNILSLEQAIEQKCDVRMKEDYLTLRDPTGTLIVKVLRAFNQFYKTTLKVEKPTCLHGREGLVVVNNSHHNDHDHVRTGGSNEDDFDSDHNITDADQHQPVQPEQHVQAEQLVQLEEHV
ncbi:hypothetical protein YC2023_076896 [Brassica napus]